MRDNRIEILLEENFRCENMTIEERNFIITFLYNTKELKDNPDMKIVTCNFKKLNDNTYKANGAMVSDKKASWFDSYIDIDGNKVTIKLDVTKLCPDNDDIHKDFSEYTVFTKTSDEVYNRKTKYLYSDTHYIDDIVIADYESIYGNNDKLQKNKKV